MCVDNVVGAIEGTFKKYDQVRGGEGAFKRKDRDPVRDRRRDGLAHLPPNPKFVQVICGTPTWNTGADTERSGTAWDEVYYSECTTLTLTGKPVAVFGLGDQEAYSENYADATGELHDVLEGLGVKVFGMTNVDDSYVHEASKAQRGDKFVGLMCDQANQDDLTEGRVEGWVKQLVGEGELERWMKRSDINSCMLLS